MAQAVLRPTARRLGRRATRRAPRPLFPPASSLRGIRGVRPACETGIDPCKGHRERDQARDAEGRRKQCRVTSQPEPKRKTPGDLEDCGDGKGEEIGGHESMRADGNSPVPGGPVRSSHTAPPSGSTVIWKRKNRQHWRPASTARAIVARTSESAGKRRRIPSAYRSWSAARRRSRTDTQPTAASARAFQSRCCSRSFARYRRSAIATTHVASRSSGMSAASAIV